MYAINRPMSLLQPHPRGAPAGIDGLPAWAQTLHTMGGPAGINDLPAWAEAFLAGYETLDTIIIGGATIAVGAFCTPATAATVGLAVLVCGPPLAAGAVATEAVGYAAWHSWEAVCDEK